MLSNYGVSLVLTTALAPSIWGTTYVATTELLPPDRPLLAATARALPAGLLLVAAARRLPQGIWWWRSLVLGALNIGVFFALLFVAAYRLPGGIAATIGAMQPLLVAVLAVGLLGERLSLRTTAAALAGVAGVSLLVTRADARLDGPGVAAAVASAFVMALGIVLNKRWPSPASLAATTGWQLTAGGLLLAPVAVLVEGPPPPGLTAANVAGYAYLSVVGSALAYALWFRGIRDLSSTSASFLVLLSPLVATVIGLLALDQGLTPAQALGALVVVGALVAAQLPSAPRARRDAPRVAARGASGR